MADNDDEDSRDSNGGGKKFKAFNAIDVQKIRLEKLMANIDKPIEIPKSSSQNKFHSAPEFVRNVMGSSAGAGSGEFHVYRNLRRKEYARLHFIENQAKNEKLDEEYRMKLEENQKKAEEATAKKRAKRQKKKEKLKAKKLKVDSQPESSTRTDDDTKDSNPIEADNDSSDS